MVRFVLFDGAPSRAECLEAERDPPKNEARWISSTFSIAPPLNAVEPADRPLRQTRQADTPDDLEKRRGSVNARDAETETQRFADAEESVNEPGRRGFGGCPPRAKRPRITGPEQKTQGEETCSSFLFLPPPSQPRPPGQSFRSAKAVLDLANEADETDLVSFVVERDSTTRLSDPTLDANLSYAHNMTTVDDSYSSTADHSGSDVSMGPPPNLPWQISSLTKLSQVRSRFMAHRVSSAPGGQPYSHPIVSVLGAISSVVGKDTSAGRVTEISFEDDSGACVRIVSWGDQGDELARAIRIGDVVFFGKLAIVENKHTRVLELRLNGSTSQVGIAYRTRVFCSQDELYRYHAGYAKVSAEAEQVWTIVDWWMRNREQ
ncbi:hypothetical protein JCM10212_001388 [Sporobolomyces blumeae]